MVVCTHSLTQKLDMWQDKVTRGQQSVIFSLSPRLPVLGHVSREIIIQLLNEDRTSVPSVSVSLFLSLAAAFLGSVKTLPGFVFFSKLFVFFMSFF